MNFEIIHFIDAIDEYKESEKALEKLCKADVLDIYGSKEYERRVIAKADLTTTFKTAIKACIED